MASFFQPRLDIQSIVLTNTKQRSFLLMDPLGPFGQTYLLHAPLSHMIPSCRQIHFCTCDLKGVYYSATKRAGGRIAFADNHHIALWIAENALNVATDLFRHIQMPNLHMSILWVLASLISSASRIVFTDDRVNYIIDKLGIAGHPILRLTRASAQVAVQEFIKELLLRDLLMETIWIYFRIGRDNQGIIQANDDDENIGIHTQRRRM
ncbi:hypothetical protein EDC96DRAFT_598595 [Choanephora cucurbitarum]|nr:hypothetical protein EDC96DRAFT_598595 [Choanephora cucurbitarum]